MKTLFDIEIVLTIHLVSTFFMVGLIWYVQVVHYPLFAYVSSCRSISFESEHIRRTSMVVIPVMLVELLSAVMLFVFQTSLAASGLILLIGVWVSTMTLQAPCHARLQNSFDPEIVRRLIKSNWIRTVMWSGRAVIAFMMFM